MIQSGSWKGLHHCAEKGSRAFHALLLTTHISVRTDSAGCRAWQDDGQSHLGVDNYCHAEWRCPFDSPTNFPTQTHTSVRWRYALKWHAHLARGPTGVGRPCHLQAAPGKTLNSKSEGKGNRLQVASFTKHWCKPDEKM